MISQQQQQQQTLKILPHQIQLLNLFQLNSLELQMHIQQEMDQNPYLEETIDQDSDHTEKTYDHNAEDDYKDWEEFCENDIPDYRSEYANYFNSEQIPEKPLKAPVDFREEAKQQLSLKKMDQRILEIAGYIVDSLEYNGFLLKDIESISDDFSFAHFITSSEEVIKALIEVQDLDPVGLGSRDIRECWLLQLARMNQKRPDVKKSIELVTHYFEDFKSHRFEKIMQMLGLDEEEFRILVQFLGRLVMNPITEYKSSISAKDNIVPDIQVRSEGEGIFSIMICGVCAENFRVSDALQEAMHATKDKGALQYLRSKMQSANWLLYALRQRNESMMKITKAIISYQKAYFEDGDVNKLKPMILKNIADMVGLDISTISRLTSNKYADTDFGIIHLKDLFTEGIINKSGVVISNRVIRNALEEVINTENKSCPYTDQQIVRILLNKGFKVARRTVAKYRDLLQIPVAQVRAMWA